LKLMLLNLHLQSLVVCILSIQVDLFYLIQIGLCALLAYDVLFPLILILLLLSYLGRDENCLHMSLIDISLFFFSFALMLLVPLLVNEKRVPVEIVLWLCLLYIHYRVRRYSSILINNDGVHLVEDIRAYVTAPDNLHSCILLAFDWLLCFFAEARGVLVTVFHPIWGSDAADALKHIVWLSTGLIIFCCARHVNIIVFVIRWIVVTAVFLLSYELKFLLFVLDLIVFRWRVCRWFNPLFLEFVVELTNVQLVAFKLASNLLWFSDLFVFRIVIIDYLIWSRSIVLVVRISRVASNRFSASELSHDLIWIVYFTRPSFVGKTILRILNRNRLKFGHVLQIWLRRISLCHQTLTYPLKLLLVITIGIKKLFAACLELRNDSGCRWHCNFLSQVPGLLLVDLIGFKRQQGINVGRAVTYAW
jgi:hypothetical protein